MQLLILPKYEAMTQYGNFTEIKMANFAGLPASGYKSIISTFLHNIAYSIAFLKLKSRTNAS